MGKKPVIREQDIVNMEYETFDMDYFEKKRDIFNEIHDNFVKDDGTEVEVWGNPQKSGFSITEYPPLPYFYQTIKMYYPNGGLESKGIFFPQTCRIGKWLECDESGNCQVIDYDKNREFGYYDVLRFLEKNGYINLITGAGRTELGYNFSMGYNYEQKHWIVEATKDRVHYIRYTLDGNSGRILREENLPTLD